jgi:uncharacterized alpha/beta hydrolase family protein
MRNTLNDEKLKTVFTEDEKKLIEKEADAGIKWIEQNPDADGAMNFAAEVTKISAYPLIRLNAQNDRDSQLRASALPGSIIDSGFEDKIKSFLKRHLL